MANELQDPWNYVNAQHYIFWSSFFITTENLVPGQSYSSWQDSHANLDDKCLTANIALSEK